MAENSLVEADIRTGEQVVRALDEAADRSLHPTAALWLNFPEEEGWRLLLALPAMARDQPQAVYTKLLETLVGRIDALSFESVALMPPDSPLIDLLSAAIETPSDAVSGIRFTNNMINGQLIDDAYIYRLTRAHPERAAAG